MSHEEALGGQAIRENAVVYDSLLGQYFKPGARRPQQGRQPARPRPGEVLRNLQRTRENYHMIDDEFQLPVLAARYLADSAVPADRKRAFLLDSSRRRRVPADAAAARAGAGRLAERGPTSSIPRRMNLVSFPKRDSTHWRSASWRDSDAGYAGGRFAMDINAIWVPQALEAIGIILHSLQELGLDQELRASADSAPALQRYAATRPSSAGRSIPGRAPASISRSSCRRGEIRNAARGQAGAGCLPLSAPTGRSV